VNVRDCLILGSGWITTDLLGGRRDCEIGPRFTYGEGGLRRGGERGNRTNVSASKLVLGETNWQVGGIGRPGVSKEAK